MDGEVGGEDAWAIRGEWEAVILGSIVEAEAESWAARVEAADGRWGAEAAAWTR